MTQLNESSTAANDSERENMSLKNSKEGINFIKNEQNIIAPNLKESKHNHSESSKQYCNEHHDQEIEFACY